MATDGVTGAPITIVVALDVNEQPVAVTVTV
jgi:hypothetical protein